MGSPRIEHNSGFSTKIPDIPMLAHPGKLKRTNFPASAMETPVESPKERYKKQKTSEASTEDRDFLGLTSGDQHGRIQAVYLPCLMCMMKIERDLDSHCCKVIPPQPYSRLLLLLKSTHACSSTLMPDELMHILRQGAYRRVNFRCESCERHRMVVFMELSSQEPRLCQGGRMNFKFLLTVIEERGIISTFGSFNQYASPSCTSFNKHFYFGGMPLGRLANEFMNFRVSCRQLGGILYLNGPSAAAIKSPAGGILDSCSSLVEAANESKREVDWSSLPALPLLNIMDRLDMFSNKRLTAVCRDWWSVSVRYPKKLYSVGDGEPWICSIKYGWEGNTWEFISVSKNRKFEVDMPEFAKSRFLFSKGGWLLLQNGGIFDQEVSSWFLVNPFTRDKIKLPNREGGNNARCCGLFKLGNDGRHPDRVYLIITEESHQTRINTARCGDKEWTSHNFTGLDRLFITPFYHVAIGDKVYCMDDKRYTTVFNLANDSVKVLPPVSSVGFITEHEGELIHFVRGRSNSNCGTQIVVHKYDDASSSWETLKHNPLMGTSWYLVDGQTSIISVAAAAEGGSSGGIKIYKLCKKVERERSWWDREYSYYYVSVRDLLTGIAQTLRVPFPDHRCPFWVDIG